MRAYGFTLLEMVVVLAILGMASTIAAPSVHRMVRSWQNADEVDAVLRRLTLLPTVAQQSGMPMRISSDEPKTLAVLKLPKGWSMTLDQPLLVRANGMCNGSTGKLDTGSQGISFRISAPFCRVERLPFDSQ